MGISLASRRKIDYVIKNLNWTQKRQINKALARINPMIADALMERDKGYPTFEKAFKFDNIDTMIEMYRERFQEINALMIANDLAPLFEADETQDPYLIHSCEEFNLWTKERHVDVIKPELGGATYAEYKPVTYREYLEKRALEEKESPYVE